MKELGKYLFILLALFAITTQNAVFASGNQDSRIEAVAQEPKTLLYTEPAQRPEWIDSVPQSTTEFYFIGVSLPFNNVASARDDARENARNQVLKYYGEFVESRAIESAGFSGNVSDTIDPFIAREEEIRRYAENIISQVGTDRYFTEAYLNSKNEEVYIVYVLCQINRQKAEDEINNFAKNISQRYTAMIRRGNNLKGTLESYITAKNALEQNTLHRMIAYYEDTTGRVGLYGYIMSNINELVNSISFASLQNKVVQRSDDVNVEVKIRSSQFPNIGPFDCRVNFLGLGFNSGYANYTIQDNSSFLMSIHTANLNPGRYTVQIELLLEEATGGIAKNITSGFSFEVASLRPVFTNREELEAGIKMAVDILAGRLIRRTDTKIDSFTLMETDIPTGLSRFLLERVTHYARNNQGRKYNIINETDKKADQAAVLSGYFRRYGNQVNEVDVIINLTTPGGDGDGSQLFAISVPVLTALNITFEPENLDKITAMQAVIDQINEVVNPPASATVTIDTNRNIGIQASFNSETRTYFHRDELGITLTADRDCYFKVIHIDVNNQMKMIYPNSYDKDNYLRANSTRAIFETAKYMLYEPYGAETILVIASSEQFSNIEQDYLVPWTTATQDTVRAAIRGTTRGTTRGTRSNQTASGEARYIINILKPHEEYEYIRPDNMKEFYEDMRRDVTRQRGSFEGNETSGFYILNNVRGSYRVSRDKPDVIQFAFYYLDNYNNGRNAGVRTRSAGFNFTINRPQNINQAIQTVRTGIEENGGVFSGNEQEGNFKAKGIAGQYRVSDLVSVTITEKPFMIPNSMIVREVRNFFGER